MPKYTPTPDDLYSTKPCFICGDDVLDENTETCGSELCKDQMETFEDDFNWSMIKSLEGES